MKRDEAIKWLNRIRYHWMIQRMNGQNGGCNSMTNSEAIEYGKEQLEIFGGQHAEFIRMAIESLQDTRGKANNVVAEIKVDTDEIMERLEQEWYKPNEWIPCSERLPEAQTEVIVSCTDDSGDTKFSYTSSGWLTTDKEYWIVDNEINNFVVAWREMPEPYKDGDVNGKND